MTAALSDRVMKPALYAKAGIPFYWMIEIDGGLSVHAYSLDSADEVNLRRERRRGAAGCTGHPTHPELSGTVVTVSAYVDVCGPLAGRKRPR